MSQEAPWPFVLEKLVLRLRYRPGYRFALQHMDRDQGSIGLTFVVRSVGYNSYHPDRGQTYRVEHRFPVPPAAFNEQSWRRWLLDRLIELEVHEACEFFQLTDGETDDPEKNERPYAPHHGPGNDPYVIFEHGTEEAARTSFRGELNPG